MLNQPPPLLLVGQVDDLDDATEKAVGLWDSVIDAGPRLGVAAATLVAGWLLSRVLRWVLHARWKRTRTPSFAVVIPKLAGWTLLAVALTAATTIAFPSIDPVDVVAGLGVVSIAAGFAFQDIFSNLLSGLLLILRQPFVKGDQIEIGEIQGTVRAITIRETEIDTFDGRRVLMPNKDVYQTAISISTARPVIRSEMIVGCSYDDDLALAAATAVEALGRTDGVVADPAPEALFVKFNESTVDLDLWWWTDAHEFERRHVRHRVVTEMMAAFDRAGLDMPWPIRSIDVMHPVPEADNSADDVLSDADRTPRH